VYVYLILCSFVLR